MMDSNLGKEEKRNKLKTAIAKQTKVTKENIFGEGVDVPLLGRYKAMKSSKLLKPFLTLRLKIQNNPSDDWKKSAYSVIKWVVNLKLTFLLLDKAWQHNSYGLQSYVIKCPP